MYDPPAEAWRELTAAVSGALPLTRHDHGFTALGGRLYVFGGMDNQGDSLYCIGRRVL